MKHLQRPLLLAVSLSVALTAAMPAFAQDAPDDGAIVAEATVPTSRLVERYAELAGSLKPRPTWSAPYAPAATSP